MIVRSSVRVPCHATKPHVNHVDNCVEGLNMKPPEAQGSAGNSVTSPDRCFTTDNRPVLIQAAPRAASRPADGPSGAEKRLCGGGGVAGFDGRRRRPCSATTTNRCPLSANTELDETDAVLSYTENVFVHNFSPILTILAHITLSTCTRLH